MAKMQLLIGTMTVFMLLSGVYVQPVDEEEPGYKCYPNGTIAIANPNSAVYTSVIATYDDGFNVHMCAVSGMQMIVITNCNWMYEITVVFSDQAKMSGIISGSEVQACSIKCNQITEHTIDVNNTLGVTLPVTVKQPVTPRYSISAGFFNRSLPGSPVYTAKIGEMVDFTMIGPVEYYLRPLRCTAYNNPSKASSTSNKTLIVDGCTTEDRLMSDFSRSENIHYFRYTAMFSVFKFYQSSDIYIECIVKVCPEADGCQLFCYDPERKRRQISDSADGIAEQDARIATIGRRLRILDDVIGGSSHIYGSLKLSVMLALLIIRMMQ